MEIIAAATSSKITTYGHRSMSMNLAAILQRAFSNQRRKSFTRHRFDRKINLICAMYLFQVYGHLEIIHFSNTTANLDDELRRTPPLHSGVIKTQHVNNLDPLCQEAQRNAGVDLKHNEQRVAEIGAGVQTRASSRANTNATSATFLCNQNSSGKNIWRLKEISFLYSLQ